MGRFAVGDTVEIRNEGIHGFPEGTQVVISAVGFEGEEGEPTYKVDWQEDGRRRSRYIEGRDLRVPKPAIPNPLSKKAREQRTLVKAKALQRELDRVKAERKSKVKVKKDPDQIADTGSDRTIANPRKVPVKAKGTPPASQKAGGKPSEPKSPKLRPLKVHKTAKELATAKEKADPKPKGTKGKPKVESGAKVSHKKAQLR